MRDISLTFDPPAGTANTPAVLRRRRGWLSPDGQRSVVAGMLALVAHMVVLWVAGFLPPTGAPIAVRVRPDEYPTALVVPLEGFYETAGSEPVEADAPRASASAAPTTQPSAMAEEAVVPVPTPTVAPAPEAPLDFSDLSVALGSVTGAAVGSGDGSTVAVAGSGGERRGAPTGTGGAQPVTHSLAQPARTRGGEWGCPWPSEAMAADIYSQNVLVRVLVEADGSVANVSAVSDPGYGFAGAAEACARREAYSPALDDAGQPVRGTTPAIRVNFRR